jgi:hypothetical protein
MRWFKPNLNSIYSLLGRTAPQPSPAAAFRTEAVRQIMLDTMIAVGLEQSHPQVYHRICFAQDIQALWYTRSDLMTALASERGESFAQEKIGGISSLFDGLLPQSLKYREPPHML